nr:hypothetical protein [Mucilaginibacter sp. X4EP1]
MIKNWLLFFGVIALAITCTQVKAQDITYNLTGKVGQYSAPAKAYLMYMNGGTDMWTRWALPKEYSPLQERPTVLR